MAYDIKQSSTQAVLLFFMTDSSDHISAKTGLSPTVTISKNGGSFASPSGAVSEIANGWYKVAGNATDTNTLGPLALHATGTGADACDIIVANIVAYDPQDSVRIGITALPNAAAEAAGGLYTRGTGAGQIAQDANGNVRVNVDTIKTNAVVNGGTITFPTNATLASTTNITAGTITTTTNLTNLPSIPANWITTAGITDGAFTAAKFAASSLNGKGDWNVGKTGYSLTAGTGLGNQTADITGNLSGSVGSVTGLTASNLDVAVSTRLASASYTAPPSVSTFLTTQITEAYRANGAAPTMAQFISEVLAHLGEASISGTTKTINKFDHSTAAETFTLDDASNPSSITRAT